MTINETTTSINVPLLRKTLEWATNHPDEHEQSVWAQRTWCGTAYCLAGRAVVEAGHDISWAEADLDIFGGGQHTTDGRDIELVAVEELGLPVDPNRAPDDPNYLSPLFDEDNTLADLWRIASELTGGEIEVPAEFQ
jgi:hypothetical protein